LSVVLVGHRLRTIPILLRTVLEVLPVVSLPEPCPARETRMETAMRMLRAKHWVPATVAGLALSQ
jgi:hypothetical protein